MFIFSQKVANKGRQKFKIRAFVRAKGSDQRKSNSTYQSKHKRNRPDNEAINRGCFTPRDGVTLRLSFCERIPSRLGGKGGNGLPEICSGAGRRLRASDQIKARLRSAGA